MERLWTRSYVFMIAGTFVLFVAFYALYPTLPLFIGQLGGNSAHVGLAMGVFMLASVAFRPIVGGLLDRFGRLPFVVGGILLFAFAMSLYRWVGGIAALIALRVLHGTSWAFASTATATAITDMIPPERRGEGIGFLGMAMTMAMAVGPVSGLWVAQELSYHALFLLGAGIACAALLLMFGARMPFQARPSTRRPLRPRRETGAAHHGVDLLSVLRLQQHHHVCPAVRRIDQGQLAGVLRRLCCYPCRGAATRGEALGPVRRGVSSCPPS